MNIAIATAQTITDSAGNVIQTFATDEFGVPSLTQGTSPEPMRYAGQQRDGESGFYDLRARYLVGVYTASAFFQDSYSPALIRPFAS